ncbi:ornithine cyclodeaminase family protein [Marinomonas sp. 2405UD68-3]|uniref:ornithine cyclodeaminase family protein n=1 Tax=Marinomonas sp. 2405UD68-3 TaxID=3391835 RepID=UPI0039C8F0FB
MKISNEVLEQSLPWPALIDAIRKQFIAGCDVPVRHHHYMETTTASDATLLLMPAFESGEYVGLKIVNVFPDNNAISLPSINADYLLYSGKTGELLAMLDGGILTARRTAAASALAAKFLAKQDASTLFVVGSGRVASLIPEAMRTIRPIRDVKVWDLNKDNAQRLVDKLSERGFNASVELDLEVGTKGADIISCATLSTTPLILGEWLKPGQHLDLIGSFTPSMRETDDTAMSTADVYIDVETAFLESGDIIEPMKTGALSKSDIKGDLAVLCKINGGRESEKSITVFKAVGTALEDLAAAKLVYNMKSKLN